MSEEYGFELMQQTKVSEINSTVSIYKHKKTGAELMSISNEDENKVFGITFRTPPDDSTGLPHIMEHSVLCGSRKYPVKEPFVELIKGSLNTFLNAFTYPDKTCYPVASTNLQDFYNLVDVYLDAVFYPLISEQTLMQEGWHYTIDQPQDDMKFKGVVFNEMKGAYSSPDDILGDESQMSLFPDTPYGLQSGGDPEVIPDLTYKKFKKFHETFYHPSNARIFFYGDDDTTERLKLLDAYLSEFEAIEVNSALPLQPPFAEPRRKILPYDAGESGENAKSYLTVNWLLPEGKDPELVLGLGILDHILIGTPASPLRKTLVESGLGEDLVGSGLSKEYRQMMFSTGMRGLKNKDLDLVEALILETLKQIAEMGIDQDNIDASLNTIEFNLRENNTGSFPRGISIMLRSLTNWLYERDPITPIAFEAPLSSIKQKLAAGDKYFEGLIQEYFLNNSHRTTVIMLPDANIAKQREVKETNRLMAAKNSMTQEQIHQTIQNAKYLKQLQETPDSLEALASIPMLKREDLEPKSLTLPIEIIREDKGKVFYHDLFTSGILYLNLGFNLKTLPQEYLPYLRLFSKALLQTGTDKEDFVSLIQRIGRETGGIYHYIYTSKKSNTNEIAAYLFLRGKTMVDQVDNLLSILLDILTSANFSNKERIRQMVLEEKSSMEAGLIPSGHRVINNRLKAKFDEAAWVTEQMSGIDYLFFVRKLAEEFDQKWEDTLTVFHTIRELLIQQTNLVCNFTIESAEKSSVMNSLSEFLIKLPDKQIHFQNWQPEKMEMAEGLTIPSQVNYVGKGANLYQLGYKYHGSINVINQYLKSTWLWEKVRVQGGAYGGFSSFDRLSGIYNFLSYRDPNLLGTLENYDHTAGFLKNLELNQSELTKSIIGSIGELDAYMLPDAKGYTAMLRYLLGVTDEERQVIRDQILNTTEADFHKFGETLELLNQQGSVVVLGSADSIQKANSENDHFLKVKQVL